MNLSQLLEMAYPKSWDAEKFQSLQSLQEKWEYCLKHLNYITAGTSRYVFAIDENRALKLARGKAGIEQNKSEIELYTQAKELSNVLAKIYNYDHKKYEWLEMEKCQKAKKQDFIEYFKVNSIEEFKKIIDVLDDMKSKKQMLNTEQEKYWWVDKLKLLAQKWPDYSFGDLKRLSSWGKRKDGKIVLIDYGLTHQIYTQYYKIKKMGPERPSTSEHPLYV